MGDGRGPRGFALRDMLVLIAVVGVVIGLLLPAISSNCERGGRRVDCLNNMKVLGLALLNFVDRHNRFPNAVTFGELPGSSAQTRQIDSTALTIVLADDPNNPTGHDLGPLCSWVVDTLPYLDWQNLYQDYDRNRVYFSDDPHDEATKGLRDDSRQITNAVVANISIRELTCPNDDTTITGRGNLSYAVNMGFTRWVGEPDKDHPDAIVGTAWEAGVDGGRANRFTWGTGGYALAKKTGLMFAGTIDGDAPWDMHHSIGSLRDGTSTTVMMAENVVGGASNGGGAYGWTLNGQPVRTNWATAHPNFVGFITSSEACGSGQDVDCSQAGDLGPTTDGKSGAGWARANRKGAFSAINYGAKNVPDQGGSPFANSLHPGGVFVALCDGSVRFVSETIDGRVWASLVTPDGQSLPDLLRQTPIAGDDVDAEWHAAQR